MPIQHFHLPDLPNVGYATDRERRLSDNIMDFMRQIERDRVRLLTIVLEGRAKWRQVAGDIWSGFKASEDGGVLDEIFAYFELQALKPQDQYDWLRSPGKRADIVRAAMPDIEAQRDGLLLMEKWKP